MRVVITGSSGLAGFAVLRELVAAGFDVLGTDLTAPPEDLAPHKIVDCRDLGQVYGALAGADAVVHLAAIPRPVFHTPEQVFQTNVMASFNVFEASATLGLSRIVYVSSVSVLGMPFAYTGFAPDYLPIDEAHAKRPEDAYALSKAIGETLAEAAVRRTAGRLSVMSLRFPWIHTPETFRDQLWPHWGDPAFGATNLWSYIDTRDAARVCRLALSSDLTGHEAFFASAANSFMNEPTAALARRFYPEAQMRFSLEDGNCSLFDYGKATRLLGYEPAYSWHNYGLDDHPVNEAPGADR